MPESPIRVFSLGNDVTGSTFYYRNPDTQACAVLPVGATYRLRTATEVAASSFAVFQEQIGEP